MTNRAEEIARKALLQSLGTEVTLADIEAVTQALRQREAEILQEIVDAFKDTPVPIEQQGGELWQTIITKLERAKQNAGTKAEEKR